MKVSGLMMFNMDLERKNGMMDVLIEDIIIREKKKDMGNMNGVIKINIGAFGKIINYVEKVFIIMLMGKNI